MLERQDLEMEVEEKVDDDLPAAGIETWTDGPGGGIPEEGQNQTFACDQSTDSALAAEAGPEDAVVMGNRSDWDGGEKDVEPECPTLERINNKTSVIVSVQGRSETAADCSTAEASKEEEVSGDNQSVTTTTPGSEPAPAAAEHPGKVIFTKVTINSLTVTFKEATVAEGFFKGY